jgi:hypothetical protein
MRIEGVVSELYDVLSLPRVQRSMAICCRTDEIGRIITIAPGAAP